MASDQLSIDDSLHGAGSLSSLQTVVYPTKPVRDKKKIQQRLLNLIPQPNWGTAAKTPSTRDRTL